ncbi:MAG: alpha/beta hydrolase [Bullifex sp.]
MAVLSFSFRSECLKKPEKVIALLPDPGALTCLSDMNVIYALHGVGEDSSSFLYKSDIVSMASRHNAVIIMPDGDRSMYQDDFFGQKYFTFITEELPNYMNGVLNIPSSRDKTWIMGFSMGAYGAVRTALMHPERYEGFASFSGLLDLRPLAATRMDEMKSDFPFFAPALDSMETTDLNPVNLMDERSSRLMGYVSCGLDDDLLICTKLFEKAALDNGCEWKFHYSEGDRHSWSFWNREFENFLTFTES